MSILNKNQIINQINNNNNFNEKELTKNEIEFLLDLFKDCTFKGKDLELLYNLVLKLQTLYLQ